MDDEMVGLQGLSPRGRGNQWDMLGWDRLEGSIPAWAGEPSPLLSSSAGGKVYPRVGGGTPWLTWSVVMHQGLSPRGRGNPTGALASQRIEGSIPAWAGEPHSLPLPGVCERVYPRVGGGTGFQQLQPAGIRGLSPRGRGNPGDGLAEREFVGSIPAWAGEPRSCTGIQQSRAVYPRVGGGTAVARGPTPAGRGLSPRGRGNRRPGPIHRGAGRSIPAWAGEPPPRAGRPCRHQVYPRVGGGT